MESTESDSIESESIESQSIDGQSIHSTSTEAPPTATVCTIRPDDSTFWDTCKAWYLFLVHLVSSVLLVVGVIGIDGHDFRIGARQSYLDSKPRLYQTQVTALVSLALVVVRLFAGSCSLLLAWRIIYILLGNRGITLSELTHLSNYRVPILPAKSQFTWSLWATVAIVLLWPAGLAAPLASSSVSWIPATRLVSNPTAISIPAVEKYADWLALIYTDMRATAVANAAALVGRDPTYAFQNTGTPLRRYFNATEAMPDGSIVNITLPYIDVKLRWIDADSTNLSQYLGDSHYTDVLDSFGARKIGLVSIQRDTIWDPQSALPEEPQVFVGKKIVAVKLDTINKGDVWKDGTIVNENTTCPTSSPDFGPLPAVKQYQGSVINSDKTFAAYDCYLVAEASITAGLYSGTNCVVNGSTASSERFATCYAHNATASLAADWLVNLALDFTSETLKYAVQMNYSQPWISPRLDAYAAGMLTLGFHASHGALVKSLGNASEKASFRPTEAVVRSSINRTRIYVWLGLNATLTLSAVLVYFAQRISAAKTVRDTAVAALTLDLARVFHDERVPGLCNAVALSGRDRKLPRMKWKEAGSVDLESSGLGSGCYHREVAFVGGSGSDAAPLDSKVKKRNVVSIVLAKLGQIPANM